MQRENPLDSKKWKPGFFTALPSAGILSLVGVVFTAIAAGVVLRLSDDQPTEKWPTEKFVMSPTVLLAIIAVISNTLLRYALSEAWTISWWRKTLKPTSISGLHKNWAFHHSILDAVFAGRSFNLIALGKILVTLAVVQGPLLQRASRTTLVSTTTPTTVNLSIPSRFLPVGYTGITYGRAPNINGLTAPFTRALRKFNNAEAMFVNYTGCSFERDCFLRDFSAPGFDISCAFKNQRYTLNMSAGGITQLFGTNITYGGESDSHTIRISSLYKPAGTTANTGDLKLTECTLREGLIRYNATLRNGTLALNPISIAANRANNTVRLQYFGRDGHGLGVTPSTIGGIYLAALNRYASAARVYMNESPFQLQVTQGMVAYENLISDASNASIAWDDPAPNIVTGLQELMFRSALEDTNYTATDWQKVQANEAGVFAKYRSDLWYLYGALAVPLLAVLVVAILMWGWWQLGRKVSLSPVEIGKALGAKALGAAGSNHNVKEILKQAGDFHVRYGDNGKGQLEISTLDRTVTEPGQGVGYS